MGEHNNVTCPNCEKRIDSKSKFCPNCGKKLKSAPAQCPKCGAELEGFETFCPGCGVELQAFEAPVTNTEEQCVQTLAAVDLTDPAQCENAWNESIAYLDRYPEGKLKFDILMTAEMARAALALYRMGRSGEPDYSLYDMQSHQSLDDIFEHEPEPLPSELRTGFRIKPLSDSEIEELASRTAVEATAEELHKGLRAYGELLLVSSTGPIDRIKEAAADRYHKKLIGGRSKAEREGISTKDLVERAEICYAAYQKGDVRNAATCFRDLTELDPLTPYNHNLLYVIYDDLREHKQALEEILFASSLDPSNLSIQCNTAMSLRRLGLYGGAVDFLINKANLPEKLDPDDPRRSEQINTLWLERKLAWMVYNGLLNHLALSRTLRTNEWQYIRNLAAHLDRREREFEQERAQSPERTALFISYRRSDSGDIVDRLAEFLCERLPDVEIFRDISGISVGEGWLEKLERAINGADIVIAIIGTGWAGRDKRGRRRLEDSDDVLRRELALALRQDVKIIPVLVNDASMPRSEDFPSELKAIAQTQAISLRSSSLKEDLERLVSEIREILKPMAEERRKTFEEWNEAFNRTGGRLKVVVSDNILFSDFKVIGRWECKIKTPEVKGKLLFAIKHDWSFKGTWKPEGVGQIPVQGLVMSKIADDKETLLGLRLEGITEDADPFAVNIPIDKRLGEGYQGTDESGGSYFLRLIERTKEGL